MLSTAEGFLLGLKCASEPHRLVAGGGARPGHRMARGVFLPPRPPGASPGGASALTQSSPPVDPPCWAAPWIGPNVAEQRNSRAVLKRLCKAKQPPRVARTRFSPNVRQSQHSDVLFKSRARHSGVGPCGPAPSFRAAGIPSWLHPPAPLGKRQAAATAPRRVPSSPSSRHQCLRFLKLRGKAWARGTGRRRLRDGQGGVATASGPSFSPSEGWQLACGPDRCQLPPERGPECSCESADEVVHPALGPHPGRGRAGACS